MSIYRILLTELIPHNAVLTIKASNQDEALKLAQEMRERDEIKWESNYEQSKPNPEVAIQEFDFVRAGKVYLEGCGVTCPYCGSASIRSESIEGEAGSASARVLCDDCNGEWVDHYELATVEMKTMTDGIRLDEPVFVSDSGAQQAAILVRGGMVDAVKCNNWMTNVKVYDADNTQDEASVLEEWEGLTLKAIHE